MTAKLVLTGFMGTGKSQAGRLAAARLGWRFIDSDREIAARAGKSIPEIFAAEGEERFRELEREAIATLAADPTPAVIATGGGALMDESNLRNLKQAGVIVCLTAQPDVIAARLARSDETRPKLLEGGQPLGQRIGELMKERAAAYARADVTIDTSALALGEVATRILAEFAAYRERRCERSP